MKFITLLIFTLILTTIYSKIKKKKLTSGHKHHSRHHTSQILNFYASNAESYAPFARLAYCPKVEIQHLDCSFCETFTDEYATFFIHSVQKENDRLFQFVIVYSDSRREIVITFSGPTTEHGNYFTSIYSSGFVQIPELGGIRIEREYWDIYSQNMRDILAEKIDKISASNRGDYSFIFVGHSFGGSLATLASYDMVTSDVVIKTENSPLVYTYGSLRIGDSEFVNKVNEAVKVIKIARKDDYVTRMPNCVYLNGRYRCYNNMNQAAHKVPMLKRYLTGYRKIFASFLETGAGKVRKVGKVGKKGKKDPIVRGTSYIGGRMFRTHTPMFYSQNFGTELVYNGPRFNSFQHARYVNQVPVYERHMRLPATFSPNVHRMYYNMNIEQC